ncbi:MAG: hypothetical protein NT076_00845 [Candidatus Pacearchaeota archaeon]|nr:hypothetical protein [Candidatus Pacearchaeota archaeon]
MILNDVKAMQAQGISDSEIIQKLNEQGVSPLEIQQALEQSNIKTVVEGNMQPSLMAQETQEYNPNQEQQEYAQQPNQEQTQQYPQYQQYSYPQYQEYQPTSDTISEISEQIVEEKLNQVKKEIFKLSDFKTLSSKKLEDLNSRLERIESMLDKIQSSILGKIGEHMQNVQDIKQEMGMMQESFSKALNPLMSRANSQRHQEKPQPKLERKQKNKESFEDLLGR